MAHPPLSRHPAQIARQIAVGLCVGPLAASADSLGPLAYRLGFRGGSRAASAGAGHKDFALIEHVAIGAVAGLEAEALATSSLAELLALVAPVLKALRARIAQGAAFTPLQIAALAALAIQPARCPSGFGAPELCEALNRAASEKANPWTPEATVAALEALCAGNALAPASLCVECTPEELWRAFVRT